MFGTDLDGDRFTAALDDGTARAAFEEDLARTREAGVRAFPTYRVVGPGANGWAPGSTSFDELGTALTSVAPSVERSSPPPMRRFVAEYDPVATREVAEVYELNDGKARQALQSFVDEGALRRERRGNGSFWHANEGGKD